MYQAFISFIDGTRFVRKGSDLEQVKALALASREYPENSEIAIYDGRHRLIAIRWDDNDWLSLAAT